MGVPDAVKESQAFNNRNQAGFSAGVAVYCSEHPVLSFVGSFTTHTLWIALEILRGVAWDKPSQSY